MEMNLDGGYCEGGGQIVRNGASYSALLKLPLTIDNIRKNRPKPGLRNQHLAGIRLVNEICKGKLVGDALNSIKIHLRPSSLKPSGSTFTADATTAGSICGTDVSSSPPIDYIIKVFNPMFTRLFCRGKNLCSIKVDRRGFMSKGGGQVTMDVETLKSGEYLTSAILLDRGSVTKIRGVIYSAGKTDPEVAQRLKKMVLGILRRSEYSKLERLDEDIVVVHESNCEGGGSGINLVAETSTGCIFGGGSMGGSKRAAEEACEELLKNLRHGGCVDECLQDMMVIFMALAKGKSQVITGPITQHTTTAFHVAKAMSGVEFSYRRLPAVEGTELKADQQERYLVECEGIGHTV
ncbi:hypothetical protein BGX27_003954 [Mortierella sp. AM989]|nr:hypothetical protein BGX27_003954 [Mortierella sp. AM989]